MKLALFDLDHTLLPFDSGMAWTRHLVAAGALPAAAEDEYLGYCRQYVAGTLDIHAMHHASMAQLGRFDAAELARWRDGFEAALAPRVPPAMQALVRGHLQAGHLCALVTATTRFIAEPCARQFGLEHVVATESHWHDGRPSGRIVGLPCFREHKPTRVAQWLATLAALGTAAPARIADFDESWFYSDSASDLPLLEAVTQPVAVAPDDRLRSLALARGWQLIERAGG